MSELSRDDLIIGNRRGEQADVLGKAVHVGNGFFSNGWIVVGEITPDQFGDQLRFRRRKSLPAHFCSPAHVFFERFMGFHDGPDCRASAIGFLCDSTLGRHERGESIIPRLRRPVTAANIQDHAADAAAQSDFAAHAVGPEAVELAFFERLCR